MTIRVAVIGAGVMGADHARIISSAIPGADLQCICDADETKARGAADATGARNVSKDPLATIEDKAVDAVLIASPDDTHAELTLASLRARKPVLCEKPLSQDVAECLRVLQAENTLGKRLVQVGYMRRFDPPYVERIISPGAAMSTYAPVFENGECWSELFTDATAIASG